MATSVSAMSHPSFVSSPVFHFRLDFNGLAQTSLDTEKPGSLARQELFGLRRILVN